MGGAGEEEEGEGSEEEQVLSRAGALVWLAVVTVCIAAMSEVIVDVIEVRVGGSGGMGLAWGAALPGMGLPCHPLLLCLLVSCIGAAGLCRKACSSHIFIAGWHVSPQSVHLHCWVACVPTVCASRLCTGRLLSGDEPRVRFLLL